MTHAKQRVIDLEMDLSQGVAGAAFERPLAMHGVCAQAARRRRAHSHAVAHIGKANSATHELVLPAGQAASAISKYKKCPVWGMDWQHYTSMMWNMTRASVAMAPMMRPSRT